MRGTKKRRQRERNIEMVDVYICYMIKVEIGYYFLHRSEHNECDSICTLQFSGYYIIYKFMRRTKVVDALLILDYDMSKPFSDSTFLLKKRLVADLFE